MGRTDAVKCERREATIQRLLVPSWMSKRRSTSMAEPDTLRYAKIPLTHGAGAIPALGFGTLIPDPLATKQATKTAKKWDFVTSIVRNATAMNNPSAMRCRRCSRRGRSSGRMCSSPRSSGIAIIVLSGSNPPSRRAAGDSGRVPKRGVGRRPADRSDRHESGGGWPDGHRSDLR
jgi:ribosomal protein L40E